MMDDRERLSEACRWYWEKRIEETLRAIKRNNMEGVYARDRYEAKDEVLKRIPKDATVSHGGSFTLEELGIPEILEKGQYRYLRRGVGSDERSQEELRAKSLTADVFLMSANAVTSNGELIALDGFGNRVAALFYGPKKVIVIAGKNKLVDTLEEGIKRIRQYVAPVHARRRKWDLPCATTGQCVDCRHPRRICNKLAVVHHERYKERISVILVGEDLGI